LPTLRRTRVLDVLLGVIGAGLLFVIFSVAGSPDRPEAPATVQVERATVVSTVSADGNIEPAQEVSLGFETGGRLTALYVREGSRVRRGQVLARVEDRPARAQVDSASADLTSADAALRRTRLGRTVAELTENRRLADQSRVAVRNAQRDLTEARRVGTTNVVALRRAVARAQVSGERADLRASILRLAQERFEVGAQAQQYAISRQQVDRVREDLQDALEDEDGSSTSLRDSPEVSVLQNKLAAAERDEQTAKSDLDTARANVRTYVRDVQSDRSALRDAQRRLGDARDELSNGIATAQQQVTTARNSLRTSEAQLDVTLAQNGVDEQGPQAADLAADLATVAGARASLEQARKALGETELVAPVDGVVGRVDAEVGELVGSGGLSSLDRESTGADQGGAGTGAGADATGGAGTSTGSSSGGDGSSVITLARTQALQVEVGFDETDAARIRPGYTATISVDALPGRKFAATVAEIDPIETLVNNVVTYEVTLVLDSPRADLKPGMTATAEVIVDEAADVLALPRTAVRTPAGAAPTVTVVRPDGRSEPRLVVTGLEGDTNVQIVGGVGLGERVVRTPSDTPASGQ
jgi:multidrug efflux pump subunit AcrA (membrane-fusion protein)